MGYGSSQYQRSAAWIASPRETEASAFVFVNRLLQEVDGASGRVSGLAKNQELWSMLMKDISSSSNGLPVILKQDLATIGFLAIRTSIAAMGDARSLAPLIQLNLEMIEALRSGVQPT